MKGNASSAQISLSAVAVSRPSSRDSMTQGPAIRKKGLSDRLETAEFHGFACQPLPEMGERRLDEGGEQRMAVTRVGGELRVELAADEPRMIRAAARSSRTGRCPARARNPQALVLELGSSCC